MNRPVNNAAQSLLELYENLRGTGHYIPDLIGCDLRDLSIFEDVYPAPLTPELKNFLVQILPQGSLDIGVFKTLPPSELLEEQQDAVPFEGNIKHGFFGLGWWTGDCDGDGWFYDLYNGRIYAVMLYHNDKESREAIHELAYKTFDDFDTWVEFLYDECRSRGWLKPWWKFW